MLTYHALEFVIVLIVDIFPNVFDFLLQLSRTSLYIYLNI